MVRCVYERVWPSPSYSTVFWKVVGPLGDVASLEKVDLGPGVGVELEFSTLTPLPLLSVFPGLERCEQVDSCSCCHVLATITVCTHKL